MYRFLVALICMLCLASILLPSLKARYRSRRDMKAGLEDHCDGAGLVLAGTVRIVADTILT